MPKLPIPEEELMLSGHVGCLGCGATLAMRYVLKALGKNTVLSIPACCWAVMPGVYPHRCLEVPMMYTAFETTGASISGLRAAYDAKGVKDVNVVGFAGDGGTADIGIQALSGMVERGTNAFYIMYDNEAYMNTGIQRSSATPFGAWTTTTPGWEWKRQPKKNMVEIMAAHNIPYTATMSVAYPEDMIKKLRKGIEIQGPKFYHIYAPCPTGWRLSPELTIHISRLAVDSCVFPLYEVIYGRYIINRKPRKKLPVGEYLKLQGRFRHLTEAEIEEIQRAVDQEWEILLRKEEISREE
ncbi:MAG: 3-methyl-2-oxobutanoate dehydrogenase subunit beta [Candidatus Thermoplasmatota archaeon]